MESSRQNRTRFFRYVTRRARIYILIGEIYAVIDLHTSEDLAVKVEKLDDKKMVLKQEVIVIKQLQSTFFALRKITF
jgi:hypothetical protein